jgi:uncharacterized protein
MKTEIIPVIHVLNIEQVMKNIHTCGLYGLKKFFLIGHQVDDKEVMDIANFIKSTYPDIWIGINLLSTPIQKRIEMGISPIDAMWFDETLNDRKTNNHLIFGGVDFKYQRKSIDLEEDCKEAMKWCDVICTSGPRTGYPPMLSKIEKMRSYIGTFPLAIASGISSENVGKFSGLVDYLMVATSITDSGELINPKKLEELLKNINGF